MAAPLSLMQNTSAPTQQPGGQQFQPANQQPTAQAGGQSLPTQSPIQLMDWQSELGKGNTNAQTRGVNANETTAHHLNNLTASNSQYIKNARQSANEASADRGMLFSSVAAGNSQRAAIDSALPIASQDASTYARTASENMGAVNADRLADQSMYGNLLGQAVGIRANLDDAERGRGWQSGENQLGREHQTSERLGQQSWQTGEREATQGWQTGEREATQGWQTGERLGQQQWQSGENQLGRDHQTTEREATQGWQTGEREATQGWQTGEREGQQNWQGGQNQADRQHQANQQQNQQQWQGVENQLNRDLDLVRQKQDQLWQSYEQELTRNFQGDQNAQQHLQQRFMQFDSSMQNFNNQMMNTLSAIYSNPNLTAQQQAQAAQNARATHESLFRSYASTMGAGLPEIYWDPYPAASAPPPGSGGGGNVGGGGGGNMGGGGGGNMGGGGGGGGPAPPGAVPVPPGGGGGGPGNPPPLRSPDIYDVATQVR